MIEAAYELSTQNGSFRRHRRTWCGETPGYLVVDTALEVTARPRGDR
jgi:hypothetical protein